MKPMLKHLILIFFKLYILEMFVFISYVLFSGIIIKNANDLDCNLQHETKLGHIFSILMCFWSYFE